MPEKIEALSDGLDWSDCYAVVVFGVRLAVLAVRNAVPAYFRQGVIALAAGSPKVDWRDLFGAFAIFEDCGHRLGIHFHDELDFVLGFSDEAKLRSTMDGYFSRPEEMRSVEVMGFVESGSGRELTFKPKGLY